MTLISSLPVEQVYRDLSNQGLTIEIGPFCVRASSTIKSVAEHIKLMYHDYSIVSGAFADFHISLKRPKGIRHLIYPQVDFYSDIEKPFKPLPLNQTNPFFEWGLNWCIATMAHQYLIIHAAVVAKGQNALLLPGHPGAGKSTLCAALVHRGWRLLSDEMALIDPLTCSVTPVPRPVSIKNASIDVIKGFAPEAVFGPVIKDTHKGTVTHIKAPESSTQQKTDKAIIRWVVFPEYHSGSMLEISRPNHAQVFMDLVGQTFNFGTLGLTAFQTLENIVNQTDIMKFRYSVLEEAIDWFDTFQP